MKKADLKKDQLELFLSNKYYEKKEKLKKRKKEIVDAAISKMLYGENYDKN
jgi:hypothetical protein